MEAKQVKDLMEAYVSIYGVQNEDIIESDIGDRARKVVGDQRQGVHGDADAIKRDMDATRDNLLKLRPYGTKGFPSVKKDTEKTTQMAHFEPEGELVDEGNLKKETNLFDYLLEYLVAEGYADTNKAAISIMANMSEEWRKSIIEQYTVNVADVKGGTQAAKNAAAGMKDKSGKPMYKPGVGVGPDFKLKGV